MSAQPWIAWYPADYRAKTSHLTFEQSEAYRRLLEAYYETRGKLKNDRPSLYRICRAMIESEKAAVDLAAKEFFNSENGSLHHQRADEELANREAHHLRLSEAGHRGGLIAGKGRPKKIIGLAQARSQSQSKIQERSKTLSANADGAREGFDVFWEAYPRKTAKKAAMKAWAKVNHKEVPSLLAAVERWRASNQWRRGIIPHPATFLNGRRWEDELDAAAIGQDLGQCMWNHNGSRGSAPRCPRPGAEERGGLVYCAEHKHLHLERIR